ncbi:MAG TPA: prepilin-type N-terminal cleavage/methylation domain-containing protein [Tepidisphaeraceae bacterium]|jgi:type II secretory pathway pseudopilin PulG
MTTRNRLMVVNQVRSIGSTQRLRRGLGLVEAMIALAIAAMLLSAVGVAFTASSAAITINDELSRATQAARVSMERMLTQCRKGTVQTTSTGTSLNFNTEKMQEVSYAYDSANQRLLYVTNYDTTDADYVLARNVTACTFSYVTGTNPATGKTCIARVAITITVTISENSVTLTGSAAPRAMISF